MKKHTLVALAALAFFADAMAAKQGPDQNPAGWPSAAAGRAVLRIADPDGTRSSSREVDALLAYLGSREHAGRVQGAVDSGTKSEDALRGLPEIEAALANSAEKDQDWIGRAVRKGTPMTSAPSRAAWTLASIKQAHGYTDYPQLRDDPKAWGEAVGLFLAKHPDVMTSAMRTPDADGASIVEELLKEVKRSTAVKEEKKEEEKKPE